MTESRSQKYLSAPSGRQRLNTFDLLLVNDLLEDIILHMCTKKVPQIQFFVILGHCYPFTPLKTQKIKIFE